MDRRAFLRKVGVGGAVAAGLGVAACTRTQRRGEAIEGPARVIVIGGGFGGATAAKYLRKMAPAVRVTLIEANRRYVACPASNWVLAGLRDMDSITFDYSTLASRYGVTVVHERVTAIDPVGRRVMTDGGMTHRYDRLIIAPGVAFRWETIEGYDEGVAERVPHAWGAGSQTRLLRQQLEAMAEGGTFLIASPPNPFRGPSAPYERASLIADYFQRHKPRSKIILLDANPSFVKQPLFARAWRELYGFGSADSLIERIPGPQGRVVAVKDDHTLIAEGSEAEYRGDVVNVIPPQKAGAVAELAGLNDASGWCPVDMATWESTRQGGIHVIGDAARQSPMAKTGYAANSAAKACAAAVVDLLNERQPQTPSYLDARYSLVSPQYGISSAMVYRLNATGEIVAVQGAGGLTPEDGDRALEAIYAKGWFANITDDLFG